MLAVVAEVFAHGAAGERRQVLHRGRIGGGGRDDDRVFERAPFLENLHELRNRRALLTDRDVDAVELLALVVAVVERLLVEEGIEEDGGLAGLAVADHELALAAPDRNQGVDGLEARRHRLVHRLAGDDAGRLDVDAAALLRLDRALAVDRVAEGVDDATEQFLADGHVDDGAGALDRVAFLDLAVGAEDHDADIVGLEVQRHAANAARELDHFARLDVVETVDAGNSVTDGQHLADFGNLGFLAEILDLIFENCGNFRGADIHQPTSFSASLRVESLVRSDVSIWREPILTMRPPSSEGSTLTIDRHVLAGYVLQRRLQFGFLGARQFMRGGDLGAGLAAMPGDHLAERANDPRYGEKAPVAGNDAKEIADEALDAGLVAQSRDGPELVLRRKGGAFDEALQIGAFADHGLEIGKIGSDPVDGVRFDGELEEGGGIASRNTGNEMRCVCHWRASLSLYLKMRVSGGPGSPNTLIG